MVSRLYDDDENELLAFEICLRSTLSNSSVIGNPTSMAHTIWERAERFVHTNRESKSLAYPLIAPQTDLPLSPTCLDNPNSQVSLPPAVL
jgi:hypothetical protein